MQADFDELKNFDYAQANVHLWVFKRSTTARRFSAFYVPTDEVLHNLLRDLVRSELDQVVEFEPYSLLGETNEGSCLSTPIAGNDYEHLKAQLDRPEQECRIRTQKDLVGAVGYVAKLTFDGHTLYAVKRTSSTWSTKRAKSLINVIFREGELTAVEDPSFTIEKNFDFYAVNDTVFIKSKRAFEAAMQFRTGYVDAFNALQQDQTFSTLFTDMQPLIDYVGTNSIHLRRMATVEQRAVFADPNFLTNLKQVSDLRGWDLKFHAGTSQLIPDAQTARTILQVLLDHRLLSELTENIYDVPNATPV